MINKVQKAQELDVSEKTIARYIRDINDYFLYQSSSKEYRPEKIIYSRKEKGYILNSKGEEHYTKKYVLAIAKVILESRGFTKREITKLIKKLLSICVYNERKVISRVIDSKL